MQNEDYNSSLTDYMSSLISLSAMQAVNLILINKIMEKKIDFIAQGNKNLHKNTLHCIYFCFVVIIQSIAIIITVSFFVFFLTCYYSSGQLKIIIQFSLSMPQFKKLLIIGKTFPMEVHFLCLHIRTTQMK